MTGRRSGIVKNTTAEHSGDPGSIPGRGGSSEKCESIRGKFLYPVFHPPCQVWGYTTGNGGDLRIICVALFPVTRHNKELVEVQPWIIRSITHLSAFTAHIQTRMEGGH